MTLAVYPGSFDPMTNGHLDITSKATLLFDEVVVAVLHNPDKRPLFSLDERLELIREAVSPWPTVRVESFTGLLSDFAAKIGARVIVRGVRNTSDLDSEMPMAHMNARLNANAYTVFFPTSPLFSDVSSSLVKQVAMHGGSLQGVVPSHIEKALRDKFLG